MRIKLCGMSRIEDIQAVNEAQPEFCGFIVDFPKSHRSVGWHEAESLASLLKPGITPVAVTVNMPVDILAAHVKRGIFSTLQLHGSEDEEYIAKLRDLAPSAFVIQAFRVKEPADVAKACESSADMILLDSGQGSGESFDWSLAASSTRPFILAGGLRPGNLQDAISSIHPWGVDMSSGLETNMHKDPAKIAAAVIEVRSTR